MSRNEDIIKRSFQSWRITVAILLGLVIAVFMVYSSLSKVYFIENPRHGTHEWIDFNQNGKVDPSIAEEFIPSAHGTYKQQQLGDILTEISWTTQSFFWIFLSLCFMVGRDAAYMMRIRTLTNNELNWLQSFHVIMIWEFASALSPGVVGGTAVAMFILNKEKIELGRSTAIIIVTAMMDNLFFILTVPVIFLFIDTSVLFPVEEVRTSSIKYLFWLAYSIKLIISLLLVTSIFIYPKLIQKLLLAIFKLPFLKKWKNIAEKTGAEIVLTSAIMKKEKFGFWFRTALSTCLSWISRYLVINCIIAAFVDINLMQHLIILGKQFMLWIIMMVSPTPGGSGVAEFAFGKLMLGLGASSLLLSGLAVIWRLISYFPYLFIGAIILPRWLKRKS
ncbi:MAG: flippase-like domain-containing protein [Flavobacteriia bacterium]|nr:flippase-like domain-containing protein [Flavobacteriia bacterium]